MAIRNLRFLFLASTMEFVRANDQCRTEVNIQGVAFKRSVFKSWSVAAPHLCDVKCGEEITCQSYNYNSELNNRTKEARPENFLSAPAWFYIRRLNGRGKKSEVDFCFSRFSPHIANLVLSHLWLRNIEKRKQISYFYCPPLGSIFKLPAISCLEIKASEGKNTIRGKYWLNPTGTGKAILINCEMACRGRS